MVSLFGPPADPLSLRGAIVCRLSVKRAPGRNGYDPAAPCRLSESPGRSLFVSFYPIALRAGVCRRRGNGSIGTCGLPLSLQPLEIEAAWFNELQ